MSKRRPFLVGSRFDGHGPRLIVDAIGKGTTQRRYLEVIGTRIVMQRLRARRCVGFFDLVSFAAWPCPDANRLAEGGGDQCTACFRRSGFNPAFYHLLQSELSEQQRAYNAEPHRVYLAAFGRGLAKVGISNARRLLVRLREQGALAALIVADADNAYDARSIEARLSRRLALPEAIAGAAKRRALADLPPVSELGDALDSRAAALTGDPELTGPTRVEGLHAAFGMEAGLEDICRSAVDLSGQRPLATAGTVRALIGDTLVATHERLGPIMVSIKAFVSHAIGDTEPDLWLPAGHGQASMF